MATATNVLARQDLRKRTQLARVNKVLIYVALTIAGLCFAFPLFWTASSSLQTWQELRSYSPKLIPEVARWENYTDLFNMVPFARWLLNSLTIVVLAVPGALITATMTAYAFARFDFFGKNVWFTVMLATMMIPSQVTLIPQYILFFNLKWINTYIPLTIGSWLGGGAFTIFLLRQFLMSIPRELDEAAIIDGAGPLRILWQILVPLMKPALITVGILQFMGTWNDFFTPFIYLHKIHLFTAAVGINFFQTAYLETTDPRDHLLMAGAASMTIPVLLVFAVAQRYFVSGVVMTGIKA
jgi:multiple sugar transport system permease protein